MGVDVQRILELGPGLLEVAMLGLGPGVDLGQLRLDGGVLLLALLVAVDDFPVALFEIGNGIGVALESALDVCLSCI